jgi:hypothetical protein
MKSYSRLVTMLTGLIVALSACSTNTFSPGEQQVIDIVWGALEPNTSSHDQAAWEIVDMQTVKGREVRDLFEGEPVPGNCAPGPTPPDNAQIAPVGSFWYVQMRPRFATPQPQPEEQFSPIAPSKVPEPFATQAHFLIDSITGKVVARKLQCVIIY